MTVPATLYDWLLFVHVVAAMVWLGGGVLLAALAVAVLRSREPEALVRFLAGLTLIGPRVLAPATAAVAGLGVWMILDSAAWDFGQLWVQIALGLFVGGLVIGAAHQSRAAIGAGKAAEDGRHDEARRQLVRWSWGYFAIVALLLVAVWDMVFKPGL